MRRPLVPVLVASVLVSVVASADPSPPKAPVVAPVRAGAGSVRVGVKPPVVAPTAHSPSSTQAFNRLFESGAGHATASPPSLPSAGASTGMLAPGGASQPRATPLLPLLLAEQDAKVDLARAKNKVFDARVKVRTIEAQIAETTTGKSTMLRRAGNALTFGAIDRRRTGDLTKELVAAKAEVVVAEQAVAPFEKRLAESTARVQAVLAEREAARASTSKP